MKHFSEPEIIDGIIQPVRVSEEGYARLDSIRSFMIHKALKIKSLEMKRDAEVRESNTGRIILLSCYITQAERMA